MKKISLITGGSRGSGAATARLAGQRDYAVCISYLCNGTAAATVVDEIKQTGASAIAVTADVSSEPDVLRLFKTVDESFGPITSVSLASDG
jgi:NAD(P)-dependent dehydrogenase (short-subunit alcohol dehydrogenase family)